MTAKLYPQLVNAHNAKYAAQQGPARSVLEGSRNCACAAGASIVHDGLALPEGQLPPSHLDFRKAAGDPKGTDGRPRGLSSAEIERAIDQLGVPRDNVARRYYGEPHATAWTLLNDGYVLQAAGSYGYINNRYRQISGDRRFDGNHSSKLSDPIEHDPAFGGKRSVLFSEGLQDGRPKAYPVPNGPQRIPWWVARGFMERLQVGAAGSEHPIGAGLGVWSAVKLAETPQQKLDRLEGELDVQLATVGDEAADMTDRNAALAAADDLLAAIEEVQP